MRPSGTPSLMFVILRLFPLPVLVRSAKYSYPVSMPCLILPEGKQRAVSERPAVACDLARGAQASVVEEGFLRHYNRVDSNPGVLIPKHHRVRDMTSMGGCLVSYVPSATLAMTVSRLAVYVHPYKPATMVFRLVSYYIGLSTMAWHPQYPCVYIRLVAPQGVVS